MSGSRHTRDEIRISNRATYWPVAPIDVVVGAPLVARLLLGVTPIGRLVQGAVLGVYLGCALRDWVDRRGIRKIAFRREFGADRDHLVSMPPEVRERARAVTCQKPVIPGRTTKRSKWCGWKWSVS